MKHLDLFSGIGGFSLAAQRVWPDIEHTFCDNDPFSQAILKKHWPTAKIYGDIRTLTAYSDELGHFHRQPQELPAERSHQTQRKFTPGFEPPFLLTGGFPCQPFSQAGKRKGTEDDRHLWPEMLRVISEFSPRWVVGENVRGLTNWNGGMVLEQIQIDLEAIGYEVQPFLIPAVAVNAPHRRDRVWIVAHASDTRGGRWDREKRGAEQGEMEQEKSEGREVRNKSKGCTGFGVNTYTKRSRLQRGGKKRQGQHGQLDRNGGDERASWNQNWLEVAARLCTLDDGLPDGLVRPKGWRNAALKAAGNAIVPQVAEQIMKAIKEYDLHTKIG